MSIRLESVVHRYGATTTLDALSLDVPPGSFTVLVGPSGSGKSTLLQVVAGLLAPSAGRVEIDGVDVTDEPVGRRDLAMVFQDYALYPHMTVAANVGFALRLDAKHGRGTRDRGAIDGAVADTCERLGLGGLLGRRPAELSGGQRQRVAIARALVRRPRVLLLDEPLAAVDAQLRQQTRTELLRLHREIGGTFVLVTHDQTEALSLASHLAVLDGGRCVQAGPPRELYRAPANRFVAGFLGSPPMNTTTRADGLPGEFLHGGRVLGWRPHDGVLGDVEGPALRLHGVVDLVEYTGDGHVLHCTDGPDRWSVTVTRLAVPPSPGDAVAVAVAEADVHVFDADGLRVAAAVPVS